MSRKKLIPLLSARAMTVSELAGQLRVLPAEIENDLEHLTKSLVHTEWQLDVTPARCRKCGFEFGPDKLRKPSKCPECKGTWLSEPVIGVVPREGRLPGAKAP